MASYSFRYTNASGAVLRVAFVQCACDEAAIAMARDTMPDDYAALEICEGERVVVSGQLAPKRQSA